MTQSSSGRRILRGTLPAVRAALGVCLLAATAGAQGLPKAEEVLDKYVEATGGKAAYEKIKNQVLHGTVELGGAVKGPMVSYHAPPNKMYVEIELQGLGKIEQGTDGKVAWERSALAGARILNGAE